MGYTASQRGPGPSISASSGKIFLSDTANRRSTACPNHPVINWPFDDLKNNVVAFDLIAGDLLILLLVFQSGNPLVIDIEVKAHLGGRYPGLFYQFGQGNAY